MIEFEKMDYSIFKIKYFLKLTQLFFFFNSTRLKSRNWVLVEQALKLLNLNYYKIYNVIGRKITRLSIFNKFTKSLISGATLFVNFNVVNISYNEFKQIVKVVNTHPLLTLLAIKFSNKIYSFSQIKNIDFSSYRKVFSVFHYLIKKKVKEKKILSLKSFYTRKKDFENQNNVI